MGLGLGDLMGSVTIPGAATAASLGDNIFNAQNAEHQMNWQAHMRNTAYQTAARDMEKAGLNRILALGSPAPTPSGAMAAPSHVADTFINATNARTQAKVGDANTHYLTEAADAQTTAATKNFADTLKANADTKLSEQNAAESRSRVALNGVLAGQATANTGYLDANARKARAEAAQAEVLKAAYEAGAPVVKSFVDYLGDFLKPGADSHSDHSARQIHDDKPHKDAGANQAKKHFYNFPIVPMSP